MRKTAFVVGLCLMTVAAGFLTLRWMVFGRLTMPDQAAIARRGQPIVQAIYDFKHDCGLWPLSLEELVPDYLSNKPDGLWLWSLPGQPVLSSPSGLPHTGVYYTFSEPEPGWYSGGDFGKGRLNVLVPVSTRPAPTPEQLHSNAIATLVARIKREPNETKRRQDYVNYLVNAKRLTEARQACEECLATFPGHWWPRLAMASLALESEREQADRALAEWVQSAREFQNYWYLAWHYRAYGNADRARAALRDAVKYPLTNRADDNQIPDFFAYTGAIWAYEGRDYQLALYLCDVWESLKQQGKHPEASYHALRAMAQLKLGRFDKARQSLELALQAKAQGGVWIDNLQDLEKAVKEENREFTYPLSQHCRYDFHLFEWDQ